MNLFKDYGRNLTFPRVNSATASVRTNEITFIQPHYKFGKLSLEVYFANYFHCLIIGHFSSIANYYNATAIYWTIAGSCTAHSQCPNVLPFEYICKCLRITSAANFTEHFREISVVEFMVLTIPGVSSVCENSYLWLCKITPSALMTRTSWYFGLPHCDSSSIFCVLMQQSLGTFSIF